MNDTTRNLVYAIADGDASGTQNAFAAAMAEKLSTRLDTMRAEVAQSMFAGQETQEEVAEETPVESEQQVG